MRFPIVRKPVSWGEYSNLSSALIESLCDLGLIDPVTGQATQNYFDLPIENGPILSYLTDTFDMTGEFHVGCSIDSRPPSFAFSATVGDMQEETDFVYRRVLDFDVFQRAGFLRKNDGIRSIRDLNALSGAYNKKGNYSESVLLGWSKSLPNKHYYSYSYVSIDFERELATLKGRIEDVGDNYLQKLIDGTIIEEMIQKNEGKPVSITDSEEATRVLFLLSQIAGKVFISRRQIVYPQRLELV